MRRHNRRLPAALAVLLAIAVVEALAWSVLVPPFQAPDEAGHFSYTQRIWERGSIPWDPNGSPVRGLPRTSNEMQTAGLWAGTDMLAFNRAARPLWTEADEDIWERRDARLGPADREDGAFIAALRNPPLYYLYATPVYAAGTRGTLFDRLFLLRLVNIPLLLAAVAFTWLIAGELLGRRRRLQFTATAPVALHPHLTNLASTHNPDNLLIAGWALALWLILLVLRRGPRVPLVAALAGTCVLVGLTHPRGLPIIVPAALAVALAWARARGLSPGRRRGLAVGGVLAAVAVVTAAAARGTGSAREFWSYVWQFYLPRVPGQTDPIGPDFWDFREVFVERFFGTFGHLEVVFPDGVLTALFWASLAGLAALAVALGVRREALRGAGAPVAVLATAVLALILVAHLGAYRGMVSAPEDPVFTGRYLLPLLPLFGVAIAFVVGSLPRRAAAVAAGVVLAVAVMLQLLGAGLMLERFYA